jgi:hypothetical protein
MSEIGRKNQPSGKQEIDSSLSSLNQNVPPCALEDGSKYIANGYS